MMLLAQAFRITNPASVAFSGAGGKTTAIFQLARLLHAAGGGAVIVTATTHLRADQIRLADTHWIAEKPEHLLGLEQCPPGVHLVTGPLDGDRTRGLDELSLQWLREISIRHGCSLLVEADGSRQRPLKAPAEHEPPIPGFVENVVVVAGLSGLGKPLTGEFVHRPEGFAALSGLAMDGIITPEALKVVLTHPAGGLKNIPAQARRLALLNQADTPELLSAGGKLAQTLLPVFDAVIVGSLHQAQFQTFEPAAGILLAAGGSSRFGQPKQLLDFHGQPFIRRVAATTLASGLSPVVVVTGAGAEQVGAAVRDLPVTIIHNADWQNGQSSSLQAGLDELPRRTGAAIFLLADQPQVPPMLLRALVEQHGLALAPIVAPMVRGQRANPVLFDRVTFPDLHGLTGDIGGRAIFSRYPVTYLPWHDESLLLDVDTLADYNRIKDLEI